MTLDQVSQLHAGDEVFWNDPDESLVLGEGPHHLKRTSRYYTIASIKIENDLDEVVLITDFDGSELQCFAHELS